MARPKSVTKEEKIKLSDLPQEVQDDLLEQARTKLTQEMIPPQTSRIVGESDPHNILSKPFKVRLRARQGMWKSDTGKIDLSIHHGTLSDKIDSKHPDFRQVARAVQMNVLEVVPVDTQEGQLPPGQNLSKGHRKTALSQVPDTIKRVLDDPEKLTIKNLAAIKDLRILKILLDMERQGRNKFGRSRPAVIKSINEQIRLIPLKQTETLGVGGMMIDDEVTEEMPEEEPAVKSNNTSLSGPSAT